MKTKFTLATFAVLVGLGFIYLIGWQSDSASAPAGEQRTSAPSAVTLAGIRMETAPLVKTTMFNADTQPLYQTSPGEASLNAVDARFETANRFQFPALLAELERTPESQVKEAMMREALTKWAALDGAATATWANLRVPFRRFLPEILQVWAGADAESAVSAWAFAKAAFANDRDEGAWFEPDFVTSAFRGMTSIPGEGVWNELNALSGVASSAAMIGMADFVSNRQVNTDFTAAMEGRVLDSGSVPLTAAFYAGAGHIAAAKEELVAVTDPAQWHAIAREIARQQAEFEPAQAVDWLQSQFEQPADSIADMVESIGMMHALNAEDVLKWLNALPESEARAAGMERILVHFPKLRPNLATQEITLE